MTDEPRKGGYIRQAWLVIILALIYGAALAGTQTALGPLIEENKRNETYQQVPKLVEGADAAKTEKVLVTGKNGKEQNVYRACDAEGKQLGWVLPATGQGFADRIDVLIGVNADVSMITGMYVLDQKETPNLGSLITGDAFRDQYRDVSTESPLEVIKGEPAPGKIVALTGATISSDSVTKIVNDAIANLKEPIQELDTK